LKHVRMSTIFVFWLLAGLAGVVSQRSAGQTGTASSRQLGAAGTPPFHAVNDGNERNEIPPDLQERALKMRNEQRQKQLVSDTSKLLALARELAADVSKASSTQAALGTSKKAEEVEKLAHGIKDKMKAD
jgi:hypothetical protein